MATLEQVCHVIARMGRLGDGIERGLHGLGLFHGRDIAGDGHAQPVGGRPARRPHDVNNAAILVQVAVFKVDMRLAVHDVLRRSQRACAVGRKNKIDHALANHFLGGITKNAFGGGTDEYKAPVWVDHANGIE